MSYDLLYLVFYGSIELILGYQDQLRLVLCINQYPSSVVYNFIFNKLELVNFLSGALPGNVSHVHQQQSINGAALCGSEVSPISAQYTTQ